MFSEIREDYSMRGILYIYGALFCFLVSTIAYADGELTYLAREKTPGIPGDGVNNADWPMYHGSYLGWRYSALDQITKDNVKNLAAAWVHQPGEVHGGLQATPIAVDGIIYYSSSYNKIFALDGATGELVWPYITDFSDGERSIGGLWPQQVMPGSSLYTPYSRGVSVSKNAVIFGTLDGRGISLDLKTGKELWSAPIVDSDVCNCNFTSPPVIIDDIAVFGPSGGDTFAFGRIFGLSVETGDILWEFETLRDHPDSWLPEHRMTGGGGGWMPGQYDPETDTLLWGMGNPSPDFDDGDDRPGDNLYTSGIVGLNPKTGELKWYHQQIPHDVWDFDAAASEFILVNEGDKKMMAHLNKNGYVYVYDRGAGEVNNVWKLANHNTWSDGVDPKTGEILNRHAPVLGEEMTVCPWVGGTRNWGHGAYNPNTGLWYTMASDHCNVVETIEGIEYVEGALAFNGNVTPIMPPDGKSDPRLVAVNPLTGEEAWRISSKLPMGGSTLTTKGGLVFYGDTSGYAHAVDASTGKSLWKFNTGSGHRSGLISYEAGGDQYIMIPSGFGGLVAEFGFGALYPEIAAYFNAAALFAFKLPN